MRGDNLLTDQFQTVPAVLAFDWCKKILCFSAQSEETLESFLCVLTCKVHEVVSCLPCLSWLFAEAVYTEVKRFNVRTKSKGKRSEYLRLSHRLMRWTFRRYQHCLKIIAFVQTSPSRFFLAGGDVCTQARKSKQTQQMSHEH